MERRPPRAPLVASSGDIPFAGHDVETLTRIDRGIFVVTDEWESLFSDARLRTRVETVRRRLSPAGGAFSHFAALAQHRLAVFGVDDDRVDLIVPSGSTRHGASDVRRHQHPLPDDDVEVVDDARVTTLERTIYDVIRVGSVETAVVAFDAVLRRIAWDDATNTYDEQVAEEFRETVRRRILAHGGARGIRQARFVVEFADGRAQLPGESLTRLRVWQVGLPAPVPQHRVQLGDRYALLDLAFPGLGRWLEFDGAAKYADDGMLGGRRPEDVLADQGRRQSLVERATGWRCDRLVWAEVLTLRAFIARQREIGLYP